MAAASWPGESSSSGLAAATTMPLATPAAAVGHGDDSDLASLADLAGACSNSISINTYSPCAGSDNNEGCPGLADAQLTGCLSSNRTPPSQRAEPRPAPGPVHPSVALEGWCPSALCRPHSAAANLEVGGSACCGGWNGYGGLRCVARLEHAPAPASGASESRAGS